MKDTFLTIGVYIYYLQLLELLFYEMKENRTISESNGRKSW